MRHHFISLAAAFAVLTTYSVAASQDSKVSTSYEPSYFSQFQPNTAQDMVSRVPGFTLQNDDGGERGFGQASLNILINGRRPSSKSSDAGDILGRIPASKVERIDIIDGASLDIPGLQGQVANIITSEGKLSGSWEYSARFEEGTEPQLLEGEFSVSGSRGNLEYVASLDIGQFTFTEDGEEQFFDGAGNVFEDRTEDRFFAGNRPGATLNLTYTPDNGHVANLNLSGELCNRRDGIRESFEAILPQGNTGMSLSDGGEDEFNYEIGGDYAFPVGDGTLKLIGLHRFEESDFNNSFREFLIGEPEFRSDFDRFDEEAEYIARAEYNWKSGEKHDWQLSWEGAFNSLDSTTEFSDNVTALIEDNVRVEERRTEGFLTHSWKFSDKINIQTSLGAEYSELGAVTSPNPPGKFFRPKGSISASYDASDKHIWRAKIERGVGQLNFGTFVSSVNLSEDIQNTGNVSIVPTQFWDGEIEVERKSGGAISGTAKVFAHYITDPIDQILFINDPNDPNDDTEGPGNLDDAWRYGIEGNMTWILDDVIAQGLRLEVEGLLQSSSIEDPVTFVNRQINDNTKWRYEFDLTHDIPNSNWAWGLNLTQFRQATFFRRDQSFQAEFTLPRNEFRITHKDIFGMRLDVIFQNFLEVNVQQERLIYSPDRNGDLIERQFFSRNRGRRVGFEISDTF